VSELRHEPRTWGRVRVLILGLASLAGLALFGACTSVSAPLREAPPRASAPAAGTGDAGVGEEPWQIPAGELSTQRLYRLRYDGPEGEVSLKVILRLEAPDRYQVTVADTLGRNLWSLDVAGAAGLWIDSRNERWCSFEGSLALAGVPLSPFPLPSLPTLLLGRLPVAPAGPVSRGPERVAFPAGRRGRLTADLGEGGEPVAWTLWRDGEPDLWWRHLGAESLLSARRVGEAGGVQMSWRQTFAEPLAGPLADLPPPAEFRAECPRADPP